MKYILILNCIIKVKKDNTKQKGGNYMKFIEGMLVGSMVTVGVTMFCTDWISKSDTKKMMKKGKQFARKMGLV